MMLCNPFRLCRRALCLALFLALFGLTLAATTALAAPGTLSLVSMGAGDPDNMSLRAHKTIEAADIFFTMGGRNPHPELTRGKPVHDAEHGLFGQGGGRTRMPADEAEKLRVENRRIIREAVAAGKNVVILDNGDPTVFGPQIGYMKEFADLNPVIVPGLSSFNAANAALRTSVVAGKARAVMLTLGALSEGRELFLAQAINEGVTLVLFMVRDLDGLVAALRGKVPATMPVAVVANAGSPAKERVIGATLATLPDKLRGVELGPYLLYIGEAVKL
ncbi:MAG: SAM-dependent methyltransferase [Desulfuromonas thiophila]|nr:SAM-dependent methyltransferase [Desulfuromonas thiophila]